MDWVGSQPNGKEKQNNVAIDKNSPLSDTGSLIDIEGTYFYCGVCSISGK